MSQTILHIFSVILPTGLLVTAMGLRIEAHGRTGIPQDHRHKTKSASPRILVAIFWTQIAFLLAIIAISYA
jgi:hypothetical protein